MDLNGWDFVFEALSSPASSRATKVEVRTVSDFPVDVTHIILECADLLQIRISKFPRLC